MSRGATCAMWSKLFIDDLLVYKIASEAQYELSFILYFVEAK